MYLLDTNILSELLRSSPAPVLIGRLASVPNRDLYTSSINRGELLYGLLHAKKGISFFTRMERLLGHVPVLSFDLRCANVYAELRADLEARGTRLDDPDLMIASVALANELILVTDNERHFRRIPGLEVENWLRKP